MFKHSTKVPRLYKVSSKIAKDVKEGIGSIKNLVYEHRKKHPNVKAMFALVATLFQKYDEIESLLKKSQFFTKEPRADPWLSKILLVELLWGKKRLGGDSTPEKTIQAYEQIFKAHLTSPSTISEKDDNKGDIKPRYVRINTLFMSLDEAIEGFRNEGWELCKFLDKTDYEGFLRKITSLEEGEFLIDIHVPNLLIFPHKTEFYKHPAYQNGSIILQDKASCLPVHILNPPPGSIVLDMCAAPGMKTTQLAAVMNNEGTIYAVERNPKRFETLNKIIEASKATCIKTANKDVLTCTAADFPNVEYILVDPSCSGSGMTDRLEHEQKASAERINNLAGFQIKILRSALTRYPNVKRVVYSTCSMYSEENEDVVRQVLETNTRFKLVPAKEYVNDTWQNFGSSDFGEIGSYCLYAKRNEDFTNGFFVAVFERLEKDEENKFFNTKVYNYKRHVQSQENRRKRKQEALEGNDENDVYKDDNAKLMDAKGQIDKLADDGIVEDNNTYDKKKHIKEEQLEVETKKNKKKRRGACESEDLIKIKSDVKKESGPKKSKRDINLSNDCKENTIEDDEVKYSDSNSFHKSRNVNDNEERVFVVNNEIKDHKGNKNEEFTDSGRFEIEIKKKKKKLKKTLLIDDIINTECDVKEEHKKEKSKRDSNTNEGQNKPGKEDYNECYISEKIEIKKEKKKKKETFANEDLIDAENYVKEKRRKKKSKSDFIDAFIDLTDEIAETDKLDRKGSKLSLLEDQELNVKRKKKRNEDIPNKPVTKKKKREEGPVVEIIGENDLEEKRQKKKSKRLSHEIENDMEAAEVIVEHKKSKKRKKQCSTTEEEVTEIIDVDNIEDSKMSRTKVSSDQDEGVAKKKHTKLHREDAESDNNVKHKKKKYVKCEEFSYEQAKSDENELDKITKKKKKN